MRTFVLALATLASLFATPAGAQTMVATVTVTEWVESGSARFVAPVAAVEDNAVAAYGPFRVLDGTHAALVDVTDGQAPAEFAAMMRAYPGIATLDMVECPGTEDDRANLRLGRMIRAAGIATHVPEGGSVRSGAVELFLAGTTRTIDDGAEFAVHSWIDDAGREAKDYPADSPENRAYLGYYREMGMDDAQARAFYAMTNSASFAHARWLGADEMRGWVEPAAPAAKVAEASPPRIAYLDLALALP